MMHGQKNIKLFFMYLCTIKFYMPWRQIY